MNRHQICDKLKITVPQLRHIVRTYNIPETLDSIASVLYLKNAGLKPREIRESLTEIKIATNEDAK